MKIHGILSFYDESPSWLAACVASLARVCDHVIACDGRYALFPADSAVSPPEQTEAIVETAAGAGLPLTLHVPGDAFYGGEVEKRNLTLKLAAAHGDPMRDWLFICDADCYVLEHSSMLRHDLEHAEEHSANVAVEEHMDTNDPRFDMPVTRQVSVASSWRTPVTLLYRMIPNLAYHGTHYSVGGSVNGQRVWLWGHPSAAQPFDASHALVVKHRNVERAVRRQEQASAYYQTRDRLGVEVRP